MHRNDRARRSTTVILLWLFVSPIVAWPRPATERALDGVWQSVGYGRLLSIDATSARLWQISASDCRPLEGARPFADILLNPRLSRSGKQLHTGMVGQLTVFAYERIARMPDFCAEQPALDSAPLHNFDALWSAFNEHYGFFPEHAVAWDELRQRYRPAAAHATTDEELFDVLVHLLAPLHDLHVSLEAGERFYDPGFTPFLDELWAGYQKRKGPPQDLERYLLATSRAYLAPGLSRYVDAGSTHALDDNLLVATMRSGSVGYLQILSESNYLTPRRQPYRLKEEITAANVAFDRAFSSFTTTQALIIDLRVNFGGEDALSLELAGRLTRQERAGFVKCGRVGSGWTAAQHTAVHPRSPGYHRPVILLISAHTISAGDEFLMLVKDYPNVISIGENSAGAYSDPLHMLLPNGWRIGISNERYLAPDGRLYEGVGIAPDIRVPVFLESIHRTGIDPALEKAIEVASKLSADIPAAFTHTQVGGKTRPLCDRRRIRYPVMSESPRAHRTISPGAAPTWPGKE